MVWGNGFSIRQIHITLYNTRCRTCIGVHYLIIYWTCDTRFRSGQISSMAKCPFHSLKCAYCVLNIERFHCNSQISSQAVILPIIMVVRIASNLFKYVPFSDKDS